MGTALWLIWEAARALGIPLAAGYFLGRWAQRRDTARERDRDRENR